MTEQDIQISELETKIAFLEETVDTLNRVVADNTRQIEALKTAVRFLSDKLRECSVSNVALPSEETPPPHY
jgi:SlyX protein